MLFQAPDAPAPVRLQGAFVSDSEIQRLVSYWQAFAGLAQPHSMAAGGIVDAQPGNLEGFHLSFIEVLPFPSKLAA
jgi:DNA segregation ATPase FtsK/SpoIIIE-like protein